MAWISGSSPFERFQETFGSYPSGTKQKQTKNSHCNQSCKWKIVKNKNMEPVPTLWDFKLLLLDRREILVFNLKMLSEFGLKEVKIMWNV